MAIAYKCDICRSLFEEYPLLQKCETKTINLRFEIEDSISKTNRDICETCLRELLGQYIEELTS